MTHPDLEALSIEQLEAAIAAKKAAMIDPLLIEARKIIEASFGARHYHGTNKLLLGDGPGRVDVIAKGNGDNYWEVRATLAALRRGMELAPQQPVAVPVDVEALAEQVLNDAAGVSTKTYVRHAIRATLTRVGAAQWPSEAELRDMAREVGATDYGRQCALEMARRLREYQTGDAS